MRNLHVKIVIINSLNDFIASKFLS